MGAAGRVVEAVTGAVLTIRGGERLDRKLQQLERRARRAIRRPAEIRVGFFGDLAEVAAAHEYGMGVPQRSFFAAALPEMERAAVTILRRRLDPLRPELSPRVANEIGAALRDILQQSIDATDTPPLSPETVRQRRGALTILVDTGAMRAAATWRVSYGAAAVQD